MKEKTWLGQKTPLLYLWIVNKGCLWIELVLNKFGTAHVSMKSDKQFWNRIRNKSYSAYTGTYEHTHIHLSTHLPIIHTQSHLLWYAIKLTWPSVELERYLDIMFVCESIYADICSYITNDWPGNIISHWYKNNFLLIHFRS